MSEYPCLDLSQLVGFEWDEGNRYKNEDKHGVLWTEIEEVFFNQPLLLHPDPRHSMEEARCFVLGKTDAGRRLMVVFTVRHGRIRVISARPMSRRERRIYEQTEKDSGV